MRLTGRSGMISKPILLHPAVRAAQLVLSLGFVGFCLRQFLVGEHVGYGGFVAFLGVMVWAFAADRAKAANRD